MSILRVEKILVALKPTINRNANSQDWKDFGTSDSYGPQECQRTMVVSCNSSQESSVLGSSESYAYQIL